MTKITLQTLLYCILLPNITIHVATLFIQERVVGAHKLIQNEITPSFLKGVSQEINKTNHISTGKYFSAHEELSPLINKLISTIAMPS